MTRQVSATERTRFQAITGNADGWASIDELVDLCDQEGFWEPAFLESATNQAKKSQIRRLMRSLKDDENWPVWASVETTDEDGKTVRRYKQETLFDVEDYRKTVDYWADRARYAGGMAKGYAKRCKKRFNVQPRLDLHD